MSALGEAQESFAREPQGRLCEVDAQRPLSRRARAQTHRGLRCTLVAWWRRRRRYKARLLAGSMRGWGAQRAQDWQRAFGPEEVRLPADAWSVCTLVERNRVGGNLLLYRFRLEVSEAGRRGGRGEGRFERVDPGTDFMVGMGVEGNGFAAGGLDRVA